MERFARFFEGFQQDLKAFAYWCIVFTIFRFAFIAVYSSQIEGLFTADVWMALWLGLRLSLKTTGVLVLFGGVLATLPSVPFKNWPAWKIRYVWHSFASIFFTLLFFVRIPYYQIFNAGFNMMIINGMYDDKYAILMTAINEYQMLWRLPVAIAVGVALSYILRGIFQMSIVKFTDIKHKKVVVLVTVFFLPTLWVFARYGGAFTSAKSINWEGSARLKSNLLNEAILDDGQALYRVNAMRRAFVKDTDVSITIGDLKEKIATVGGNLNTSTIDEAFKRTVVAPKMEQQPSNVVLIVGESFGLWPFMPQFQELGLVKETTKLQSSENGFAVNTMLAGGRGTMQSINVLLTGLPNTGIYENYQPNSYKTKYKMGIGYIMKKLGYKTIFWYGGFGGWQNLKDMVLSQSFDEFRCADEFVYSGGNSWGCPDAVLFDEVEKYVDRQRNEKTFHIVLTVSNHPPYIIDVDKEGFERNVIIEKLPEDIARDKKSIDMLGHIWYMDREIGTFVKNVEIQKPDSLFVVSGDHSERFPFIKEQIQRTLSAIPCIFYGVGINNDMFKDVNVGVHNQLAGTIAELIAPAGFEYDAMFESMFSKVIVYNHFLFAENNELDLLARNITIDKQAADMRKIAAWRVLKGNKICDE